MNLNQLPVRVRTLSRFRAAHPWFDNQPTDWSLDVYKMVPEYIAENAAPIAATPAPAGDLTPSDYLGIRAELDGQYHILPGSLAGLWKTKQVGTEDLPGLLRAVEPRLEQSDFSPLTNSRFYLWFAAGFPIFLLILSAVFGGLMTGNTASYAEQQGQKTTNAAWFAQPMREGQFVNGDNGVVPEGIFELSAPVKFPDGVQGFSTSGYVLGWFRAAGGERRLMLIDERMAAAPSSFLLYGTTLSPATLGIGEDVLKQVRAKAPNVDTTQILCFGALRRVGAGEKIKTIFASPFSVEHIFLLALPLIGLFPLGTLLYLRGRRRRQTNWLLAQRAQRQI